MTYIMINSYGFDTRGIYAFAKNRFLRLYPSYWVVLALSTLIVLWVGGDNSKSYREAIFLPDTLPSVLQNITLIYFDLFPGAVSPRLSPPTWALTVELLFYFLIALGLSKSKKTTTFWFALSSTYMAVTHIAGLGYGYRYSIVIAGTLPFSIGAMLYHYKDELGVILQKYFFSANIVLLIFLLVFNGILGACVKHYKLHELLFTFSFYFNYLINALIVIFLIYSPLPKISKELDTKIGDYSYPIYLFHWQAGLLSSMILWSSPVKGLNIKGVTTTLLALIICILVSYLIVNFIDKPIEKIRKRVKNSANR